MDKIALKKVDLGNVARPQQLEPYIHQTANVASGTKISLGTFVSPVGDFSGPAEGAPYLLIIIIKNVSSTTENAAMASPPHTICPHRRSTSTCSDCLVLQTGSSFQGEVPVAPITVFVTDPALQDSNNPFINGGYRVIAPAPARSNGPVGQRAETPRTVASTQGPFTNEAWYRAIADHDLVNGHSTDLANVHQPPRESSRSGGSGTVTNARIASHGIQINGTRSAARSNVSARGSTDGLQRHGEGAVNDRAQHDDGTGGEESSNEGECNEEEGRDEHRR
ncbi:hypothetical protein B0A48_05751 [Cryoendolithus antarcticus]|uniref:Uncharacterized protein n=1 Tax=Cryoendolithus antarcticus TaxID=1507870 RepID=A0A1V8TC90_9PEZI|nr:hypothetical protein B0A48_05751 [Cryoendolithus antarcticus]